MIGKNLLWVAKQHGRSVSTILETYGAWIEGSQAEDLDAIKRAMESNPRSSFRLCLASEIPIQCAEFGTGSSQHRLTRGMRGDGMVEREGLENALEDKQNSNLLICFEPKPPLDTHRSPDLALDLALA